MANRANRLRIVKDETGRTQWPSVGTILECRPYLDEIARHRVVSSQGTDYVVATVAEHGAGTTFVTGAYPVARGYLVMLRQPLFEVRCVSHESAIEAHLDLVHALAEMGTASVRAQRALLARRRRERTTAVGNVSRIGARTGIELELAMATVPLECVV